MRRRPRPRRVDVVVPAAVPPAPSGSEAPEAGPPRSEGAPLRPVNLRAEAMYVLLPEEERGVQRDDLSSDGQRNTSSRLNEANVLPSVRKARPSTGFVWPSRANRSCPVNGS